MTLFRIFIDGRQPTDVDGDIFAALAAAEDIYLVEIDVLGGDDGDLDYVSPGLAWKLDWADGPRTRLDLFVDGRYCGIGVEACQAPQVPALRQFRPTPPMFLVVTYDPGCTPVMDECGRYTSRAAAEKYAATLGVVFGWRPGWRTEVIEMCDACVDNEQLRHSSTHLESHKAGVR